MQFSISSLTTEAGRSTTSPAATSSAVCLSSTWIADMLSHLSRLSFVRQRLILRRFLRQLKQLLQRLDRRQGIDVQILELLNEFIVGGSDQR